MPADITTERLHALVSADWVDVEVIMAQLIPTVAPGKAKRRYQRRSEAHRERMGQTRDEARVLTEDEQIASGARSIVNERILSNVGNGRFELDNTNGHRRIRLRPVSSDDGSSEVCPTCTRPFPNAVAKRTTTSTPRPQTKSTVIYVTFPRTAEPRPPSESDASSG